MDIKRLLVNELKRITSEIEKGNCNLSTEEMFAIMDSVSNVYMNKEEACKMLNISRPTFDRMIHDGKLPSGKKIVGSRQLFWKRNELIRFFE